MIVTERRKGEKRNYCTTPHLFLTHTNKSALKSSVDQWNKRCICTYVCSVFKLQVICAYSQQGLLPWHNYLYTMQGMLFYGRHTTDTTPQTSDYGCKTTDITPFMQNHLRHTSGITQRTSKHVTRWTSYYWRQTMDVTGTTDITTWTSYKWCNATDAKPRTS